jgi:hypothetical protein
MPMTNFTSATSQQCFRMSVTITIVDIIHSPVFCLKHSVSEIGFSLRLQVEPTQLGTTDRASLCQEDG